MARPTRHTAARQRTRREVSTAWAVAAIALVVVIIAGIAYVSLLRRARKFDITAFGEGIVNVQDTLPISGARIGVVVRPQPAEGGGLLIIEVPAGGPAKSAGIQVGDVIVEVEGVRVRHPGHLARATGRVPVGQEVAVHVRRGDQTKVLSVPRQATPVGTAGTSARRGGGLPGAAGPMGR